MAHPFPPTVLYSFGPVNMRLMICDIEARWYFDFDRSDGTFPDHHTTASISSSP